MGSKSEEYREWVENVAEENEGFQEIQEALRDLARSGGRVLNFSHHDLDGTTSAAIMKLGLEALGAEVHSRFPMGFHLSPGELLRRLRECEPVDAVLITDRGTDESYDELTRLHERIILIDHHPSRSSPKRCLWYNPSISDGDQTAAAHLCHMLITSLGISSPYLDFYALLGCRGDFAFDPVTGERGEFVRPFIDYAEEALPNLFQVVKGRPTRYDIAFRDRTTRINQIAEILNASCYAHNYSGRSPKLSGIYGPTLCFQILRRVVEEEWPLQEMNFTEIEEWLRGFPEGEVLSEIYRLYLEDWERAMEEMERVTRIAVAGETSVYFVMGRETPLMPLAASVKLHELKRSEDGEVLLVVFHEGPSSINISARGTGDQIHCGFLLNALARRIGERYGLAREVSGGGHLKAGECIVPLKVLKMEKVMEEFTALLHDIGLIDHLYRKGSLPKSGFKRAEELGLRYIGR